MKFNYAILYFKSVFLLVHAGAFEDGMGLFRLQKWIKENVRDVLDESDEILHCKYQLIYTLGKRKSSSYFFWAIFISPISELCIIGRTPRYWRDDPMDSNSRYFKCSPSGVEFAA